MAGIKVQKDPCDKVHHGGWTAKIFCWVLIVFLMFFVPNGVISFYAHEAAVAAAWQEEALADTVAAFDASTAEEARRRRTEEMSRRWVDERRRQRDEREVLYRERREAIEHRRRESVERQQQLAAEEHRQREAALATIWGRRANALAAEVDALAAAMMEAPTDVDEEEEAEVEEEETEVEDDDDDEFEWSDDDGPHPDETTDQQRALVESFESEKKLQDDAQAREEAQIRRAVELSLRRSREGGGGRTAGAAASGHRPTQGEEARAGGATA
ncbi:hypothetical protein QYE76_046290 [Lolium multiflorum]|uniref:Transmembrane protein n=1 Tax=Lolium multiflorum TaxID=4521 RepID=A0AAD8WY85_LOLMU|nr:hypothetical protein QYE76_046290 [Lolium multiflorum]